MKGSGLVVGAGYANGVGGAAALAFAESGCHMVAMGRSADKLATIPAAAGTLDAHVDIVTGDVTDPSEIEAAVTRAEALGPLRVVVFNAGTNVIKGFLETTPEEAEVMWRTNALAGFVTIQAALRRMVPHGQGTILVTGATAALRGGKGFSAFAGSKAALRNYAQSAAREFGPKGVHVCHLIVDGVISGDRTMTEAKGALKSYIDSKPENEFLTPRSIAAAMVMLAGQPTDAWTFELDLRPATETW
ncbi:MAG: SDR family NAD(P)-dependent oxidoreductase [Pseudomonadota bacterium]